MDRVSERDGAALRDRRRPCRHRGLSYRIGGPDRRAGPHGAGGGEVL